MKVYHKKGEKMEMETNYHRLTTKYGKSMLSKKEVAIKLGVSQSTINRRLNENALAELPKFRKFGNGLKAKYLFSISALAEFLEA
jgi:predicted DNA-binding transcriptional regulator AlpA